MATTFEIESKKLRTTKEEEEEDDDDDNNVPLPGFRFHPTDEELVGFYLRRKVDNQPISIELIHQVDIYKYDPWELPKARNVGGDGEWYFFCKRGRKYRNSIRPNRVTGSGFWKATGIDRPIYSSSVAASSHSTCIGLKKSLVYYKGSAGKGTKTDWMMHEFRLPPSDDDSAGNGTQEVEVWTLCRILKRNSSQKNRMPEWREASGRRNQLSNSKPVGRDYRDNNWQSYNISFQSPAAVVQDDDKRPFAHFQPSMPSNELNRALVSQTNSISEAPSTASFPSFTSSDGNDWDDLRWVVEHGASSPVYFK